MFRMKQKTNNNAENLFRAIRRSRKLTDIIIVKKIYLTNLGEISPTVGI